MEVKKLLAMKNHAQVFKYFFWKIIVSRFKLKIPIRILVLSIISFFFVCYHYFRAQVVDLFPRFLLPSKSWWKLVFISYYIVSKWIIETKIGCSRILISLPILYLTCESYLSGSFHFSFFSKATKKRKNQLSFSGKIQIFLYRK